jgi:hypothetical protein
VSLHCADTPAPLGQCVASQKVGMRIPVWSLSCHTRCYAVLLEVEVLGASLTIS